MKSSELLRDYLTPRVARGKVALLGFGREGQSTYRLFRRFFPEMNLTILDQVETLPVKAAQLIAGDRHLELLLGAKYLVNLDQFETIFKTPGVSPYLIQVQEALGRGAWVTSQTEVFFSLFGSQVIAVTGTKGKSTTCQVITQVLKQAGKKVLFIGNIGAPAFDALENVNPETLVVYETSSHQCEGLTVSPHIGVMLNLFVDHLDYYPSLEAYGLAKRALFIHQEEGDLCLANLGDTRVEALTRGLKSSRVGFALEEQMGTAVWVKNGWIESYDEKLMPTDEIPLKGEHNLLNVMPAIIVAHNLGIKSENIRRFLRKVTPVEKRLETIGEVRGVTFIDDALATIPEATIAALEALGSQVATLIVGGFDRGQDFTSLAQRIAASDIKTLILFPTTGQRIADLVSSYNHTITSYPVTNMADAVRMALAHTPQGKTALLSTASASFGLFKDYRDRSEQYWQALEREKHENH